MSAPSQYWESQCFTPGEVERALTVLAAVDASVGHTRSFTGLDRTHDTEWLYHKMLTAAKTADAEAGWGLLTSGKVQPADDLIYDRFGPAYTDTEFKWHCDALDGDPARLVSTVAYFTEPCEYKGGVLQLKLREGGVDRVVDKQYKPGWCVAFPSSTLEHGVTPVVEGERRSMLLIAGRGARQMCAPDLA